MMPQIAPVQSARKNAMPMDRDRYPENWEEISKQIRFGRAQGKCECTGQCGSDHPSGRCNAPHLEAIFRKEDEPWIWLEADDLFERTWAGEDMGAFSIDHTLVILTTAHLGAPHPDGTPGDKHDKMDCRPENLMAMCQRCHLLFDADEHKANAAKTRYKKKIEGGQIELLPEEES